MTTETTKLQAQAKKGIDLCREGKWEKGLAVLGTIAEADRQGTELPGLFYSYLGYGIARFERKAREGLALCQHAIKVEFYEAENYLNLARIYLLRNRRGKAVAALQRALKLNPRLAAAKRLAREIGFRRRPVIPFLSRSNPVNRYLGILRHQLGSKSNEPKGADI